MGAHPIFGRAAGDPPYAMTKLLYIKPRAILSGGGMAEESAVLVEGERIVAVGPARDLPRPSEATEMIMEDLLLAPGLIDLQINGAFGLDFTATPAAIWEVASKLLQYGVAGFLPTIITSPLETVEAAQEVINPGPPPGFEGAIPLGLHLEGPFLNPAKRGAHNPAHLRLPDPAVIANWSPETGVRLVTLAPELPGALAIIRTLVERGVIVSAGHSMATLEEAKAGIEAGITYGTHLFNAMPPLDHREPGLAGALLANRHISIGIIADGIHVHPDMVALAWEAKGPAQVSLVTDAMAAMGMPPGKYPLGDMDVIVDANSARLPDGRLAGSLLTLDQALRNLVSFTGCAPTDAIATVTTVPANLLRISAERGHIAPGLRADMTLFTPDMKVVATFVGGKLVYGR
jgi:N-acetylglucosamine-6-phosphate deacetylase